MTTPDMTAPAAGEAASMTAAAAATVVAVFALLIAVVNADDVGRLSSSTAAGLIVITSVVCAVGFRSLFSRAHVLTSAAALVLTLMGAGRAAALVLPLLVVVGALHLASIEQRYPRTIPLGRTAAAAGAAFVTAVVLEGFTFGPLSNPDDGAGGSSGSRIEPSQPDAPTEPNAVQRVIEQVAEFFRRDEQPPIDDAAPVAESASPQPPPDGGGIDWIRLLLFALAVFVVAALVALLVRWWRRRAATAAAGDERPDAVLRRLERIGETAARGRRGSEGPIAYGTAVNDLTGDQRLSEAGSIVSDYVYRPDPTTQTAANTAELDRALSDLETSPPPPLVSSAPTRRERGRVAVTNLFKRR